jgi:predicted Zn-dependent protease with MMP-like domain
MARAPAHAAAPARAAHNPAMTTEPDPTDAAETPATAGDAETGTDATETAGDATAAALDPAAMFEDLVNDAIDSIPEGFRDRLDSVAIVIEEEPTAEELRTTGAFGLLGLYTGVPRTAWGASDIAYPSRIAIYRGPHLRQFGVGQALADGVLETVRHEIAHHFGISDARLDELWHRSRR